MFEENISLCLLFLKILIQYTYSLEWLLFSMIYFTNTFSDLDFLTEYLGTSQRSNTSMFSMYQSLIIIFIIVNSAFGLYIKNKQSYLQLNI